MRLSILLACCILITSCHVGKYVVYNFADIDDYKKFHDRTLEKSEKPFYFFDGRQQSISLNMEKYGVQSKEDLNRINAEHKTVAFLIIRNDTLLYDWYADKYDRSTTLTSFSMAKSYVSTLIGIAIDEGYIKSVKEPITNYITDFRNPGFEIITIEHVLNMRTGIFYKENYYSPFGNVAIGYYGRNLDRHLQKIKVKEDPDKRFDYISIATQILGVILEKATGKTLSQYCEEKLWMKLGTEYDATWSLDRKEGREKAFCCLNAKAIDYAKIGRLYFNGGNWDGEQVVSENWVNASTKKSSDSKDMFYAYQWWHYPKYDGELAGKNVDFYMQGHMGQYVYMSPEKNIILVRLGKGRAGVNWNGFLSDLADRMK